MTNNLVQSVIYAECPVFRIVMLSVILLNVIFLGVMVALLLLFRNRKFAFLVLSHFVNLM